MKTRALLLFSFVLSTSLLGCRDEDNDPDRSSSPDDFQEYLHKTATQLEVEVAYEPDAQPYVGNTGQNKTWSLTQENLDKLIEGHSRLQNAIIPYELTEMSELPSLNQASFTTRGLLDLAERYRKKERVGTNAAVFVMFLDGKLEVNGEPSDGVLGVHLSGTSVIAIFKPVVQSVGLTETQKKYVEQSTVIHEIGHAFGLVNTGLPPVNEHVDAEHPAHCNNDDCVMYYANEGSSGALKLVQKIITEGNRILFDQNCIEDVRAF